MARAHPHTLESPAENYHLDEALRLSWGSPQVQARKRDLKRFQFSRQNLLSSESPLASGF